MSFLRVRDLTVTFSRPGKPPVRAVDGVSFDVASGQTVGIVGESGSGKSVTSLAVMRLLPARNVRVTGSIMLGDQELLTLPARQMRDVRGRDVAMIFQDPMTSLNPVVTVGRQLVEVIVRHDRKSTTAARHDAIALLDRVGIPDPVRRLREYPHQLSGGMRQRVMIAMAIACRPRLLIADEPTTALDVTIQAQILDLLRDLVEESGSALVMITHDLGVVAGLCEQVHVMYSGRIVESAPAAGLFARPAHPYTDGLLRSIPRIDDDHHGRLHTIRGSVRDVVAWEHGCAFQPRCDHAVDACLGGPPPVLDLSDGPPRQVRCPRPMNQPAPAPGTDRREVSA
ncbi:dipeptide/oligopeptide/nickel ABC transporter ATP-binding protein [Micromonospora craterilacus]|uniref:Dipeptide/oligopeptide/nickel ABC transporter ATP-binding protein n=1 Tax=Micromonospora craterilacus TaxID=1655439 RepID=A0A2W2EKU3_9ACTN|nr:ABC transporter ATP-binding protein [Micromonospora craterilacus]PZG17275.1 dipeptide/oligopeptide/nickel ABC transporter ATP-binding protein [Micromonospora craterilacus]